MGKTRRLWVVLAALLADPHIKKAIQQKRPEQPPKNLKSLYKALQGEPLEIQDCTFYLPQDYLTRFAFHHLEGDRVAVLLGLSHYAEVCRGRQAHLKLLLPVPAALKEPLARAAAGQEGFLMQAHDKIAGDQVTKVVLSEIKEGKESSGSGSGDTKGREAAP